MSAEAPEVETVTACPHCDGTDIYRRAMRGNAHAGNPDHGYYCNECRESFDSPTVRPRKPNTGGGWSAGRPNNLAVDGELLEKVRKAMGIGQEEDEP